MTECRYLRWLRPWVFPAVLLAAFEWYARRAAALDGSLWQATGFTFGTAVLGLLLGAVLGTVLGLVLGLSRRAAQLGVLSIEVLRPVPCVALIALSMRTFGFGVRMELGIVAFATFWPLLVLVQSAVQQIPRLLEVSRVPGLSARERT